MRRLLVAVATIALVLPAAGSAFHLRMQTLKIDGINAVFDEAKRETTYSVAGLADSDPSANCCSYTWTLHLSAVDRKKPVDKGCNNHGVLTGTDPTFTWHHGNTGDPVSDDGCSHDALGIYGHQGFVIVTVTDDSGFFCVAHYSGTIGSDAAAAAGIAAAGKPECGERGNDRPPHGATCRCALLTGRLVPSGIKELPLGPHQTLHLHLTFHWILNCTKGTGGCAASFTLPRTRHAPNPEQHDPGYVTSYDIVRGKGTKAESGEVSFLCRGSCPKVTEGTFEVDLSSVSKGLDALHRSDESLPIVLHRSCQGRELAALHLALAFDSAGKLDLRRSKLR